MEVKCQICGKDFEAKRGDAKYCSICYKVKRKEWERKTEAKRRFVGECQICGKPISRGSKRCESCRFLGDKNPAWKGGIHKAVNGYVYIYAPSHPKADKYHGRYVAEHRLVWEKAHGELLPDGWLIHHINGIRDDNRPENLVALKPSGHSGKTLQQLLQKRIRDLESQLQAPTS